MSRSLTCVASHAVLLSLSCAGAPVEIGGIVLRPGPQDAVRVSRRDWTWGRAETHPVISFDLESSRFRYALRHDSPGQPRVGIEAPTRCNWYQSGMVRLTLDGEPFVATEEELLAHEGDKGRVTMAWRGERGRLRYDFVLLPDDDRLYMQVTLEPAVPPKSIEIGLTNYVSGFNRRNPDHELHTPLRAIGEGGTAALDPAAEFGVFYSDRALDPADERGEGPSALLVSPVGLQSLTVRTGGYGVGTVLRFSPDTTQIRFAFWEFAGWTNRDALDYWRQSIADAHGRLHDPAAFTVDGDATPPVAVPPPIPSWVERAVGDGTDEERSGDQREQEYTDNLYTGVSTEVATPHLTWAKPYSRGTCRVLVIGPRWGQRETVELMQRFDFDCDVLMTMKHNLLAGSGYGPVQLMTPDRVARQFDEVLTRSFDVIAIGLFDWSQLTLAHRVQLLRMVYEDGAGLVFVTPGKHAELRQLFAAGPEGQGSLTRLLAGVPWGELRGLQESTPASLLRAGRFGKGRWVALGYRTGGTNHILTPSRMPWPPEEHWEYDYYHSLLGRVLLWAAGREPQATIAAVDAQSVVRADLPCRATAEIQADVPLGECTMAFTCHRLQSGKELPGTSRTVHVKEGGQAAPFEVPKLPAGRFMLNFHLRDPAGAVVAWSSFPLTVTHDCRVNGPDLERDAFDAGEPVAGRVGLSRELREEETLRIGLLDNHGRLLGETVHRQGREWPFLFPGVQPLGTNIHTVRALLTDAYGEAARADSEFSVRGRERPGFHLATWEEPQSDRLSDLWYARLRELGFDGVYYTLGRKDYVAASRLIARNDLFGVPNFAAYSAKPEPSGIGPIHRNCLHDPEYLAAVDQRNSAVARSWGRYDVLYYTDGSDKKLDGQCFGVDTLGAFRIHLKQRHETIERLNRAWGTSFTSWDAVVPDGLEQARERGSFRSWLEHIRFMEDAFVNHDRRMLETLQAEDRGALMGHDGYGRLNSHDGADWRKLLRVNTYYNLYTYQDPPQLEITRSIADCFPKVKERSIYYGSYSGHFGNYPFLRRLPWYALLHNYTGLFCWTANGKVTYSTMTSFMLGPDFRPTKSFMVGKEQIDEINGGIVQLVSRATRLHNGVAIYYDHATAVHAVTALKHPTVLVKAYTALERQLEDLGLQYTYVVPQQIAANLLSKEGYRVLFLVQALAMSRETASAVSAFAQAGGTVVADVTPATHDGHLQPVADGSLLAGVLGEPGIVRRIGRGRGLLLADAGADYPRVRFEPGGAELRTMLQEGLAEAQVARPVALIRDDGEHGVPGLELVVYRAGRARIVGVLHSAPSAVSATLRLPEDRHVYDLRNHTQVGFVSEWPVALDEGRTALYAVLPQAVGDLVASAGPTARRGQPFTFTVSARLSDDRPSLGPHAFPVRVYDPTGAENVPYGQILTPGAQATATGAIPFALNDPPGTWAVRVTDRISGLSRTLKVDLR